MPKPAVEHMSEKVPRVSFRRRSAACVTPTGSSDEDRATADQSGSSSPCKRNATAGPRKARASDGVVPVAW